MRFIWISAWKDVGRLRRDPLSLAIPMAIPLILGVLLNLIFGGGNATPQGRLLVADEDGTFVSNVLTGAFGREPLSKMVLVEKVPREEGRARIERGDASALLIIPRGLQDAVLRNQPAGLQLFTNPAQRILPNIIQEVLSIMVEGEFYLQQVAAEQLRSYDRGRAPTELEIIAASVAANRLVTNLRKYLDPPLIELQTAVSQESAPPKSFAAIFFPSMIFMGLLFLSNTLAADIWKERNSGTLRRLCATPAELAAFLAGRVLFVVLVMLCVAVVGILTARWLANVPVANAPAAVLWLVFTGAVFFLLFLLLTLQASTQRAANVIANLVIFPLMMAGGSFFPFEAMPAWMARIGAWTPNGWAVVQFKAIVDGSGSAGKLTAATASLVVVSALAFVVALRKLRRGFAL
jgi:ABC-type multidrug transport system permease subunit